MSSDDSIVMLIVAPFRWTMPLLGLARQRCDVSIDLSPKWFRGSDTCWCRVGQVGTRCFGPLNAYFLSVFRLYNCQTLYGFDAINSLSTHKWWFFVERLCDFLFMMQLSRNVSESSLLCLWSSDFINFYVYCLFQKVDVWRQNYNMLGISWARPA